jgi:TonB-linked SusC/RagA family outer membrane protein
MRKRFVTRRSLVPLLALLCAGSAAAQSGTATVTGQVTDSAAKAPLPNAEVILSNDAAGAARTARTNTAGRYTFTGVAAGPTTVSVRLVGFAPRAQRVTVNDGATITADFALAQRTTQLDQVVITGTGGVTQRRAVGNVVETIDAKSVMEIAPARSVDQLIGARTPGLVVLPSTGQVGTGAQLRVRAASSLTLSNDPIVYIDGVRMDAGIGTSSRGPVQRGGGGASRLNDINPEDIESIEVIKGPAAATLYGTEASNGVVQIITKRGKSGKPQFTFNTRQGTNWLANPEGRAGMLYRPGPNGTIIGLNLYKHEAEEGKGEIFHNGRNEGYQGAVSGGTDASRYYLSGTYDNDVGVVSWNWDRKFTGRANLDMLATDKLRFQGSVGHVRDRIRLAQNDINTDPFSQLVWGNVLQINGPTRGFSNTPPEEWKNVVGRADNDRTTLSFTADYNPFSWLTNRVVTGLDVSAENSSLLYPRTPLGASDPIGSDGLGRKNAFRTSRSILTLDYSGSAKWGLGQALQMTTSVGLQHYRSETSQIGATANTFPAEPLTTISNGTSTSGNEAYVANATVGMYVQQAAAWNNRVFLTAALRGDDNSTFGEDFKAAYYPKVSGSWVLSEEPWFKLPFVNDLRLRGALGAAGTQPGTFDAVRLYQSTTGYQDQPGLIPRSFGNPQLKPERSQELELGFESTVLNGKVDLSYTNYRRNITDAIVNVPIPPSLGYPGNQVINIGKVSGWGNEFQANARLVDTKYVDWEFGTQLARNGNRIDNMGGASFFTVGGGGQAQNRVGYGIADFFMYKVRKPVLTASGAADLNASICDGGRGKGGVEAGGPDVPCAQAPRVYWGHSQPIWQMGYNTTVTVFDRLRLYARVDGNGGHYQSDTEVRALHNQGSTLGVINKDPLLAVYRAIEADAPGTYRASFLRLREVSATYTVHPSLVKRIGATSASLSVAGRNLSMLWTAQDGWKTSRDGMIKIPIADQHVWDPEIRAVGDLSNGFQTIMPPTASFTTSLRLTF